MILEPKRKRGRPPGERGPYKEKGFLRHKYQVTIPFWLIEEIRKKAAAEGISAGRLIEKALLGENPEMAVARAVAPVAGMSGVPGINTCVSE
jgi:hypothetical protein